MTSSTEGNPRDSVSPSSTVPLVAVAGATGFIGRALIQEMLGKVPMIALSREKGKSRKKHEGSMDSSHNIEWRPADFFSVESVSSALQGAHTAVYLIHSMMPTARLDQSRFEDTDLWLADTFAQAAALARVQRIIYLGGIIPPYDEKGDAKNNLADEELSLHLRSRQEVEQALASTGIPVTTLRAGLVIGAEGSSFQILYLLVKRLPWMLCPKWAWTCTQPISLSDVVCLIQFCLNHPEIPFGAYDIGGPDLTTYRDLMLESARLLGLKRRFFNIRFFTPELSTLWVCLVTGASPKLVSPLIKSLGYRMSVREDRLLRLYNYSTGESLKSMHESLKESLKAASPLLRRDTAQRKRARSQERWVRSIQRLTSIGSWTAPQIAEEYFCWLDSKLRPWIRVTQKSDGEVYFSAEILKWQWCLLKLKKLLSPNPESIATYSILGGALSRLPTGENSAPGVFEFRVAQNRTYALVGLHRFTPRLPWLIYKHSQAVIHLLVMVAFAQQLRKKPN